MSIHYLLDGYNIIHQMPSVLSLATLEDRRRGLIRFIEQRRPQGSLNNPVTIVFDGNPEVFGGMVSSMVKVVFSQGESADDMIKKIVARAKNTKNIIVVSDDRDIQYAIRALGAKPNGTQVFLSKAKAPEGRKQAASKAQGKRRQGPGQKTLSERPKVIPKSEESKITAELVKIWLDSGKKRKDRS